MRRLILLALTSGLLSACAIGPDYQRDTPPLPDAWRLDAEAHKPALDARWWTRFDDPVLDALIAAAEQHNQDLRLAVARVDEARALAGIAQADLLPSLNASAQGSRARGSTVGLQPAPGRPIVEDKQAAATLSFELDLWGKLRRANEAAQASLLASQANRDAVRLTLLAQVAQGYFSLRALDEQFSLAESTLATRQQALLLQEKRFKGGITSELDYRQAQAEAAVAAAAVPALAQQAQQAESALAVLVGRSPRDIVAGGLPRGKAIGALTAPPAVPAGLPSSLLTRRPDLQAAEQNLVAANARIGVARAAFLPSISLTGLLGSESVALNNLFNGPAATWSFAANLAMPLFDFGKTAAGVDAASARQRQALAQYQLAIQTAFKEAQDALVAHRKTREAAEARATQVGALKRSLRLARLRYDNGYSSYLEVLDAERGLFQAELDAIDAQRQRLSATVELYKALGGGWQADKADKS